MESEPELESSHWPGVGVGIGAGTDRSRPSLEVSHLGNFFYTENVMGTLSKAQRSRSYVKGKSQNIFKKKGRWTHNNVKLLH